MCFTAPSSKCAFTAPVSKCAHMAPAQVSGQFIDVHFHKKPYLWRGITCSFSKLSNCHDSRMPCGSGPVGTALVCAAAVAHICICLFSFLLAVKFLKETCRAKDLCNVGFWLWVLAQFHSWQNKRLKQTFNAHHNSTLTIIKEYYLFYWGKKVN